MAIEETKNIFSCGATCAIIRSILYKGDVREYHRNITTTYCLIELADARKYGELTRRNGE